MQLPHCHMIYFTLNASNALIKDLMLTEMSKQGNYLNIRKQK